MYLTDVQQDRCGLHEVWDVFLAILNALLVVVVPYVIGQFSTRYRTALALSLTCAILLTAFQLYLRSAAAQLQFGTAFVSFIGWAVIAAISAGAGYGIGQLALRYKNFWHRNK